MPSEKSASRILSEARKLIGTPWTHQNDDCAGLLIKVGLALPVSEPLYSALVELRDSPEYKNYTHTPDPRLIKTFLDTYLTRVMKRELIPGDIIVVGAPLIPRHLAFVGDRGHPLSMIHSYGRPQKNPKARWGEVEEHGLTEPWFNRIKYCYRWLEPG